MATATRFRTSATGVLYGLGAAMLVASCGQAAATDGGLDVRADENDSAIDAQGADTVMTDAADARADSVDAVDVATLPLSCEARFWRYQVGRNNAGYSDAVALADQSFAYIKMRVDDLNARGANITLGGILALLYWEANAKVAFVNDACAENSYVRTAMCWQTPQARYSYQLGMGAIHTSNFYPCRDTTYTGRMRTRLLAALSAHGFTPTAAQIATVNADLQTVCAGYAPTAVDYYILAVHSAFAVPTDTHANDLANVGRFPFFTPEVSIDMFFGELGGNPPALTSDRQALVVFGGTDASYRDPAVQDRILGTYTTWAAANCR